ncbi:uncharacterized protein LOC135137536 [Zophobas morio]|uniref:uncharacterized protein LOC135137536 n=1 Tax=Zophobas morio TaxID=2755281 RepID=UPI00308273CD
MYTTFEEERQEIRKMEQELKPKREQSEKKLLEENGGRSKQTFRKRPGTTDKGKKYEDMVAANIVLQLVSDSEIKDFYISSNDEEFGDFDDVVVEIETCQRIETKALQLKHTNNKRQLTTNQLASKTGNFSIVKYFNSAKKILNKTHQFILFTTNGLEISDDTKFKLDGEQFYLKIIKVRHLEDSFDILRISKNIDFYYKFHIIEDEWTRQNPEKIQQYQAFFKSFRLYTNQECLEILTKSTMNRFTEMFFSNEETFKKYVDVISEWSLKEGRKEKLSKKITQRTIALRLLSSHLEPFVFDLVNDKMKILRDAIYLFDITLLEKEDINVVNKLWGDLDKSIDLKKLNKVRSCYFLSDVEDLDAIMMMQLLWLMNKCPLIVKDHENIEKALQLCPDAKFIILGEGKCSEWMKKYSIFQNLSQLESKLESYEKVLENFTISLQGKDELNLKTALKENEQFIRYLTVNNLLRMSNGACYINGQKENFPNLYIDRYLSVNIIDIKYLQHVDQNTVIILNCEDNSERLKISKKHTVTDIDGFYSKTNPTIFDTPIFIMSKNKCSESEFQKICSKTPKSNSVHYFTFFNNNLEWGRSRGDVSELRNYKLPNHSKNENEIWSSEFSNNINLVTGDPGMGKTELTKSLKNKCCFKYWTVIINPADVNFFFKSLGNCKISEYVERFETFVLDEKYKHCRRFEIEFFKRCLKQNNIIYVWDALDEILSKNLDATLDLILRLSLKGAIQWVTARQHLRNSLETKLNVLSMSINQFSESEQEDYIRKRLQYLVSSADDMKRTMERIKSTFELTQHIDILGIPLQIFMLTEVFRQNEETYLKLLNTTFLLTDLYRHFIEGKFEFFYGGKVPVKGDYWEEEVRKKKEEKLKHYERFALELIFPEEVLKQLKIDCLQDINSISEDLATVGIVTGVQNGIPQFAHVSFAEYFVALYFSKNFEMIRKEVFFGQKYNNVRFFFDMLTGKNSPVHIAILYKNFDEMKYYDDEIIKGKDDCGRSALHLICSWGQRQERLTVQNKLMCYVIEAKRAISCSAETKEYSNALFFLLDKCEILEQDLLYKITPLAWARESESLGAELLLLQSRKLQLDRSYSPSDRINLLIFAAFLGYAEVVKLVVKEKLNIFNNELNCIIKFDSSTPLIVASREGHVTVVEYLLKCGAKINGADKYGRTPFFEASSSGHEKTLEYLAKNGANINRSDKYDRTPLFAASSNGHEKIIECLVKCGAKINHTNKYGRTPLFVASLNGHQKTVECLAKCGAKINRADNDGRTPLFAASSNGHEKIIEYLVKFGAAVNHVDDSGWTPLYAASWNNHLKAVECLMKCGAETKRVDNDGWTPLFAASWNGHNETVECLAQCGAEINHPNVDGRTPLHAASLNGHLKTIECLMQHGAEINCTDNDGRTSLFAASRNGHIKSVEYLVKHLAEINAANKDGWTPLHTALFKRHGKIVEYLVTRGAEINRGNTEGWIPLYTASWDGNEKTVELLLKCGAEINRANNHGRTPLFAAAANGHQKIVDCLVKCGAEVNRADNRGQTPLFAASSNGHEKIVECLVQCGAEVNRADNHGRTPLYAASSNGRKKVVECLVKCGAEIYRVDNE